MKGKRSLPRLCWVALIIFLFSGCAQNVSEAKNQVCFHAQCVEVEIAEKPEEITRGLQFRQSLGLNDGMLFIFHVSQPYSFWMKDTLIPLDMIWMDYSKRVVHITQNVAPCKSDPCPVYTPPIASMYVLEVNAGQASALGLKINDQAEFKLAN